MSSRKCFDIDKLVEGFPHWLTNSHNLDYVSAFHLNGVSWGGLMSQVSAMVNSTRAYKRPVATIIQLRLKSTLSMIFDCCNTF